jgi:hypothetical protein
MSCLVFVCFLQWCDGFQIFWDVLLCHQKDLWRWRQCVTVKCWGTLNLVIQCHIPENLKASHCCANLRWCDTEDLVTVWFGMCIGSTLLEGSTVFVFRPMCGGNVSVWDIGTCPPHYISRHLCKIVKSNCYLSHVCPSVYPHVTNRLPQNVMSKNFLEICQENLSFIWIWQECWVLYSTVQYCTILYMNINMNVWLYLPVLLRMRNILHKSCIEYRNTHFVIFL